MASIFGVIELENVVQVSDKTRIGVDKSFVTKDSPAIVKVEIKPEASESFIDVTGSSYRDWFLDWVYIGASRTVTVSCKITTVLEVIADPMHSPPIVGVTEVSQTFTKTLNVVTAVDDALFSNDNDLSALEPDIMKWVPDGRSSWLNIHRAAQEKIIDWLNKSGIVGTDKLPLTKAAVVSVNEVKYWSRDLALALIFTGIQNAVGDVFETKAKFYFGEAAKGSNRAKLRLDLNADGVIDTDESVSFVTKDLVRD